jgi:light-regulated signal transduction histidine kinase (bacteriophytochrome)
MTALAQDVFAEQAALVPGRPLQLDLKPLPPARGDQAMIRVVWSNLIANAIKFTGPRTPAVIEIGSLEREGQMVYYVKDNGVGFDMAYAGKLFGVFQRLHSAAQFGGTGVGLALTQRVWAEAQVDVGATFYFSFPAVKEAS